MRRLVGGPGALSPRPLAVAVHSPFGLLPSDSQRAQDPGLLCPHPHTHPPRRGDFYPDTGGDGHTKQDCELAASARWLPQWAPRLAAWGPITYLGDDRYCHQPCCEQVLAQHSHFLLVCLPQSHPTLYEWLADFEHQGPLPTWVTTRWTGTQRLTDTYRSPPVSG